jgi:diaminohydroxyphosphoribosylaminopyrimidine deaminase/5-amino-6-(5-phosphoribosylamino)uracil reductase
MQRALELAKGGRGRVSPNPLVGAVVARDGETIGEGFHAELGGLHAEVDALADCERRGEDPRGATVYVTPAASRRVRLRSSAPASAES